MSPTESTKLEYFIGIYMRMVDAKFQRVQSFCSSLSHDSRSLAPILSVHFFLYSQEIKSEIETNKRLQWWPTIIMSASFACTHKIESSWHSTHSASLFIRRFHGEKTWLDVLLLRWMRFYDRPEYGLKLCSNLLTKERQSIDVKLKECDMFNEHQ